MLPLLLAEADSSSIGLVVQALSALATLGLTVFLLFRGIGGKDQQRQVEPTALHAFASEMSAQTKMLSKLDREMGETRAGVRAVDDKITTQSEQVDNAFKRINAISLESSNVRARFDDHVAEHREGRRHA